MDPEEEARRAAEEAARAASPPEAAPAVDYSRRVVVNGEPREFATAEEAQAFLATVPERLRERITPDSAEAHAARRTRREFGDRSIAAGAAGVARGATLGLSDLAARGVGGTEAADYLRNLEEANPGASTAGELLGNVAPVLLAGPLGAEAAAGRGLLRGAVAAVGAPVRAAAGLGEAVGGMAARGLLGAGTGAGRRIAARAVGVGLEGAIDNAAAEAGSMLSESALGTGDPALTAEMALSRIGSASLLGLGVGSILGGTAAGVGAGLRGVRDAGAEVLRRGWGGTVGTELSPTVASVFAAIGDSGEEGAVAIRRFAGLGEEGRRLRRLVDRGDGVYDDGTLRINEALGPMEAANARVLRYWREGLRHGEMERLVDPALLERQAEMAPALWNDVMERIAVLRRDFPGTTAGGRARGLERELRARMNASVTRLRNGATTPEARVRLSAELNTVLNATKRDIDGLLHSARGMGPIADELRGVADRIRTNLEDAAVWGDRAAAAHRDVNAAFRRFLTTRQAFARRFLETGGTLDSLNEINPFDPIPQPDSARVRSFLGGVGTVANDTAEATFRETTDSAGALLDAMERHLTLDPGARAAAVEARRHLASLRDAYSTVTSEARDLNQWRHLDSNRSLGRSLLGGMIGSAVGGPVGGLAMSALMQPGQVIRAMGILERWTSMAASDVTSGIRRFVSGGREAASGVARRARTAAVVGSVRAYNARIERLEEESSSPARTTERLTAATEGMDVAPRVRSAMIATAVRGNAYLASVRPRSGAIPGEVFPRARPPGPADVSRFLRIARAVDDPMSIVRDLESGEVSPDAVAAVRAVYPRLYQRIRSEAYRHVVEHGEDIPRDRLVTLGTLLDIPTVPSLHPSIMGVMQAGYAMAEQAAAVAAPPPSSRNPRLAEGLATEVESLERRTGA